MSKQATKRVRRALKLTVSRSPLPSHTDIGGYPLMYLFTDGGVCCAKCANRNIADIDAANRGEHRRNSHGGWAIDAVDVHWEGEPEICDHCGDSIESAYGPVEA